MAATGKARVRKEIRKLNSAELEKYRAAVAALQAKMGAGGYADLAGYHGIPKYHCPHHSPLFLPWHREYILRFEQALIAIDATVTLPYWDWTLNPAGAEGIPAAFTARTWTPPGGGTGTRPNPLLSAPMNGGSATTRNPLGISALRPLASLVGRASGQAGFRAFSSALESPHDSLHTWVRGSMGRTQTAAYDPLFWSHHAAVDRQWARWQDSPLGAPPNMAEMALALPGFSTRKVSDVILYRNLGYVYDEETMTPSDAPRIIPLSRGPLLTTQQLDFDQDEQRVSLFIHGLKSTEESYNVSVFVDDDTANRDTPIDDNPKYCGTFGIFGGHDHKEGTTAGGEPVGSVRVLNLTKSLVKRYGGSGKFTIKLKFVVTDMDGNDVAFAKLPVEGFSVIAD